MDKCLGTLLNQDLPHDQYEIILVNDGSPDNSLEIAEDYASRYSNIRVVSYEVNRGLAGARQAGTDVAKGEYMCYVDPDDYIECNSFANVLSQMENEHLDMLRFNYQMVNEDYAPIEKPQDARIIDYSPAVMSGTDFLCKRLGYGCFVWAYIFRTSLISNSGVKFRQGDYFDDTAWLPQIIRKAERVGMTPQVRYYYFQRTDSLVNTATADSISRKLDAELVVIDRLNEQKKYAEQDVQEWYNGMNSKLAFSILSTAAVSLPEKYKHYADCVREHGLFPLSCPNVSAFQKFKIALLNISPKLFYTLLRLKNR